VPSLAAGALILVLVISGWDQIQAWRVLQGETVTVVPDASRTAGTVEESLRVSAALRNHVYRFQARTLLEFLATRSGWPVIRNVHQDLRQVLERLRSSLSSKERG
jgi:hypothetical protein